MTVKDLIDELEYTISHLYVLQVMKYSSISLISVLLILQTVSYIKQSMSIPILDNMYVPASRGEANMPA